MTDPSAPPIQAILDRIATGYANPQYALHWRNPVQLLLATILAAQCTDERVNQVTPGLFERFPDAATFATSSTEAIAAAIARISFPNKKAVAIQEVCQILVRDFGGEVPRDLDTLVRLPRVGRKTAHVLLNVAFGEASGIMVDTHVERVVRRLGLTVATKPEQIEAELVRQIPQPRWIPFGLAMVLHGRHVCTSKAPSCRGCLFNNICPKVGV